MIAITIDLTRGNKLLIKHHSVKAVEVVVRDAKGQTIALGYADKAELQSFVKSL